LTFRITDGEADITNVASGAATLEIDDGANTDTPTLDRLIDGSDDALTIKMRDAVQNTDMNLADEETITIDASTSSLTTTGNFTTTDMTSLTVTGDNAVDLSTVTSTKIATVDVSGLDAAFTADFSASTKAMTVTGNSGTSAGAMSVTTGSGNDTLTGTSQADTIDVGNGSDTVRGGDGNDGITLGAGIDTIIFEATAAANDMDTLTNYSAGTAAAGGDTLDFSAFIGAGSVAQNGGATTAITVFTAANNDDTDITNKFAIFEAGAGAVTVGAAETALIAEINGGGDAFSIADNGKAIVAYGDSGQADAYVFYIDDSLDGTAGTIGAADVVAVLDLTTLDLDTLITTNIDLVA
jgi:Ca2+-binding RTX toxin-like protein